MILPNQTFFRPTKRFVDWVVERAAGRLIVDCGAGQGFLTKKLRDAGADVLALDVNEREKTFTEVVEVDCLQFDFPRSCLPIIARPSHGPWIWRVVEHALQDWGSARAEAVLYVGKSSNVDRDLDFEGHCYDIKQLGKNCGKDGEGVWEIRSSYAGREKLEEWVLIQPKYWTDPEWVEDGGDYWLNLSGGHCPKDHTPGEVLDRKQVRSYKDLDWSVTGLFRGDGSSGWLDPMGKLHVCESRAHDQYAMLILHTTPDALDKLNWIRVYNAPGKNCSWTGGRDWICITHHPTEAQLQWLDEKGHEVEPDDRL